MREFKRALGRLCRDRRSVAALCILGAEVLCVLLLPPLLGLEPNLTDRAAGFWAPPSAEHWLGTVSGDARRAVRVQYHSGHWTFGMDFHRPAGVWERAGDPGKGVYHRGTGTGGQEPYHHVPERAAQCGGPGLGGPGPTGGEGDPLRVQPELFGRGYPSTPGQLGKSDAARIQSGGPHRKALGLAPARAVHRLDCHLPSTGRGRPAGCTGPQVYYYKQAVCGLICTRLFAGLKVYLQQKTWINPRKYC